MSTPIPQSVADGWLDLYGTPNLLIFAGAPFNLVPSMMQSSFTQYYLQASAVVVPDDSQCIMNRNLLAWSLLRPERRDTTDLEDMFDAPQASPSSLNSVLFGSIVIIAALSMGVIFAVVKKFSYRNATKQIVLDLELPPLDVSSLPPASGSETPMALGSL